MSHLARLGPSLRYLSLAKCLTSSSPLEGGGEGLPGLLHLATHCYKLRYLNLRGCSAVTDSALLSLSRGCSRLRSLDIGKCSVSDSGLGQLARQLPGLRKLSVRGCPRVGDGGVVAVARRCPGLQHLNIQDTRVTGQGCAAIARFCTRCYIEHTALLS